MMMMMMMMMLIMMIIMLIIMMMMHSPHVKILNGVGSGLRDGPLEKLWVGGGGGEAEEGNFEPQEFFSLSNSMYEFFLGLTRIFFLYFARSPPPHKFSNGPSLNTVEPPESDHPKCNSLVVAYMRWSLNKRVELHEVFY